MSKPEPSPLTVACPQCYAPPNRPCRSTTGKKRRSHGKRRELARTVERSASKPRQRTGNKGHRLMYTAAPSKEIRAKQRKTRKAQPVTVKKLDPQTGAIVAETTIDATTFKKRRLPRQERLDASVKRDVARERARAASQNAQVKLKADFLRRQEASEKSHAEA